MPIQVLVMRPVERHAGPFRTAIIYFISGIGGYYVAGIFSPNDVGMGADPAVYGFLGVHLVELFQAWQVCACILCVFRVRVCVYASTCIYIYMDHSCGWG